MATTTKKKRSKGAGSNAAGTPLVSPQRKREVLGLILMALAILLTLALVTYTPADRPLAHSLSVEAFTPGENRAQNALGVVGAALARLMVPAFLGYNAVLFTGLLFAWGYVVFRDRRPLYLPLLTGLLGGGAFLLAALFGWVSLTFEQDLYLWSGTWGLGVASWLQHIFGTAGSFILLSLLLAITTLLVVDHDIQRSMDRVEEVLQHAGDGFVTWWEHRRERLAEGRAERRERMEAHRKEKEAARAARERERTPPRTDTRRAGPAPAPERTERAKPLAPEAVEADGTLNDLFRQAPPRPQQDAPALPERARPAPPRPALPSPPSPNTGTAEPPQPQLKVRERIEEEKADPNEREAGAPDEDLPYSFPPIDLLDEPDESEQRIDYNELEENKQVLLDKLETYKIEITDINAIVGPTVTMYELTPAPGVKISRITSLEDDLAMAMAARGIRMIAPIPGKSAIGVEIPNRHREFVRIRDMIGTARFRDNRMELPVTMGKSIEGEVFLEDLTKMPHLLVAGATGSGKSVGVNALITGLLYACHPANLKFVMIDPKKIELAQYSRIIDHYIAMPPEADDPIITDFAQAFGVLKSCEKEMERRYDLLSKATVRGIKDYNKKVAAGQLKPQDGHEHLPYIVVIVDELADLMMTAGKEIEGPIARLAQMARAVGIHLVLATQRPSVDVITGLIKANFPSRMAYQVASKVDSRTILDQNGAEGLVGNGDLLYMNGSRIVRLQGPFVSVDEVDEITLFIGEQPGAGPYMLPSADEPEGSTERESEVLEDTDDLFEEAARIIVRSQQGSVSLLQRKLSVGYTRAARIVDQLEDAGIVGPFEGSKARQVLLGSEAELDAFLSTDEE